MYASAWGLGHRMQRLRAIGARVCHPRASHQRPAALRAPRERHLRAGRAAGLVGGARDARGLAAATDRAGDAGRQKSLQSSAVIHTKTKARRGGDRRPLPGGALCKGSRAAVHSVNGTAVAAAGRGALAEIEIDAPFKVFRTGASGLCYACSQRIHLAPCGPRR